MIDYPPIWLEFTPWTISRQHWETSERWGRAHMGFSKRIDTILNWTELTPCNACTPVTCTVQMSEYCQFMIIIYTNHKTLIYNIIINKGQSYVFSKSESFWLACLMRAVKIHQLSKTSAELVIFTDFHGLDNGRTYSHKLSKNVAPTPIPDRFERSIQLQCGRWRGVGGGIWTSTFTVCNRERSPWDKSITASGARCSQDTFQHTNRTGQKQNHHVHMSGAGPQKSIQSSPRQESLVRILIIVSNGEPQNGRHSRQLAQFWKQSEIQLAHKAKK